MAGRGNPFSRDYSTGNSSESSGIHNPIPEERSKEHLFSVDNEVVNNLRRHTRAYVKNIGGFPIIPELPRREYKRKDHPILEDSVLVGDWEELVETALQEVVLPWILLTVLLFTLLFTHPLTLHPESWQA